jgi:hypothetical protein
MQAALRSAYLPWRRKPAPPGRICRVENFQKFFVNPAARAAARSQEKFKGGKVKCRCRVRKSQAAKCRTSAIQQLEKWQQSGSVKIILLKTEEVETLHKPYYH